MEVCWIQTTMISIPSLSLQIWSMTAFADVSAASYSAIKLLSVAVSILSLGPSIVSLEKFMNEHAHSTLQRIQNNMNLQRDTAADADETRDVPGRGAERENAIVLETKVKNPNQLQIHDADADDDDHDASSDSEDGFNLDSEVPVGFKMDDDGYARNKVSTEHQEQAMDENEIGSQYRAFYKLKRPKLEVVQYPKKF